MYLRLFNNHSIVSVSLWIVLGDMTVRHDLAERRGMKRKHRALIVHERKSRVVGVERSLNSATWSEYIWNLRSVLRVVKHWCRSSKCWLEMNWSRQSGHHGRRWHRDRASERRRWDYRSWQG